MHSVTCSVCSKSFQARDKRTLACSSACKLTRMRDKYQKLTGAQLLPTGTTGAMHEMAVCIDLLRRGFNVFRSVSQNAPFDIAAYRANAMLRVEVTTGHTKPAGKLVHPKKDHNKFDVLAIVEHSGAITYEPPFTDD